MTERPKIGLIGLAVMGQNLVLNLERNGFGVAVYNRTKERTDEFMEGPAAGKNITPAYDMKAFVQAVEKPRRILIMVKAGAPVDAVIEELEPLLDSGRPRHGLRELVFRGHRTPLRCAGRKGDKLPRSGRFRRRRRGPVGSEHHAGRPTGCL